MMMRRSISLMLALAAALRVVSAQPSIDRAFTSFWDAKDPREAAAASAAIVKSGVSFNEALSRLKKGRTYGNDVARGVVRLSNKTPVAEFLYTLDIPASYDPATQYQARVQLHGGVGRPQGTVRGNGSIGSLAGDEQIYVLPNSWDETPWWGDWQLANLRTILDHVKRTYNVDENRIAMSGVSDGATGAYYFAMRDTTPFAAFLPLNGFIMVLASPSLGVREQLFPQNLLNKPFFVVNGGKDPLYPTASVEPFVRHLQKSGVTLDYLPQPDAGHNTAWWPDVKNVFEAFVRSHPRDPHPATLTWEAEKGAAARAHWLVIDTLATRRGAETVLPDANDYAAGTEPNFGVRVTGMRITSVMAGTNAEAIGLKTGDWVLSVNDRSLPGGLDLVEFLSIFNAGDRLTFRVSRDNKPTEVSGVFNPKPMPRILPLFPKQGEWGRVDLVREGNTVRATTRGVAAFTLLVSPDVFDFNRPLTVIADGRPVFNGRIERSVATLMKWAALDNDRTMLYGAEVHVQVGE